jgi:hypothetical protein
MDRTPTPDDRSWAAFPDALRRLIEAELRDGNAVADIGHTHPATPATAWVMLSRPVHPSRRCSRSGWHFHEHRGSHHAGRFSTEDGAWFVLEPPLPPPEPADMDAIREAFAERVRRADARRFEDR